MVLMNKNCQQIYRWNFFWLYFLSKVIIYLSKDKNQHFETWIFLTFSYICGPFLPSWIKIRIRIWIHWTDWIRIISDPDPKHCFRKSFTIIYLNKMDSSLECYSRRILTLTVVFACLYDNIGYPYRMLVPGTICVDAVLFNLHKVGTGQRQIPSLFVPYTLNILFNSSIPVYFIFSF